MIQIARLLSFVFHPLLMPGYCVFILLNYNIYLAHVIPFSVKQLIYGMIIVTTFLMPALTSYLLLKKGMIQSLDMETTAERRIPFIATALFYICGFYLLKLLPLPRVLNLVILGATVAVIIALIINLWWKISIHLIGIGGLVGTFSGLSRILMADFEIPIILGIACAGLLGTSRLMLSSHTPPQIYAGFFVGFLSEFLMFGG